MHFRLAVWSQCSFRFHGFVLSDVTFFFLLGAGAGTDWEDPEDPTVIAENELLGAASSIDAAAKKLANLRPRISSTKVIHYFLFYRSIDQTSSIASLDPHSLKSLLAVRYV